MTLRSSLSRRARGIVAFGLSWSFLAACGGSSPTASDAGTDAATTKTPAVHRATAAACPTDRPASTASGIPGGACAKDADCTQGTNGRCIPIGVNPPTCSYDECTKDADCGGAGVCQCRADQDRGANVCRQGSCRTDADCGVVGKGFCSPSAFGISQSCREGIPAGAFGYFCHGANDACTDDADCGPTGQVACVFDVAATRWTCRTLSCTL